MYLRRARPLRSLSRLVAGVVTSCVLATGSSALSSQVAWGSVHHLEGPPGISVSAFGADDAVMAGFRPLASAGRGMVAVVLPGADGPGSTTDAGSNATAGISNAALRSAGLSPTQYAVQTADGSDATQYTDVVNDISHGARVIVLDPINSGVGGRSRLSPNRTGSR